MAVKNKIFQPGSILHEVIDESLRSMGTTFVAWCRENNVHPSTARNATHGQSSGARGEELRERIIDAAGRDTVQIPYTKRMMMEAYRLKEASPTLMRGAAA